MNSTLIGIVVSSGSKNKSKDSIAACSIKLISSDGAMIGKSPMPIATDVSPGRTIISVKPTAPITSSSGCIVIALSIWLEAGSTIR
jgi:hypothetical protein